MTVDQSYTCPSCHQSFSVSTTQSARFCPVCGLPVKPENESSENILSNRYHLTERIGKGGMGEVFLAYDSVCGRQIALKKIRSDLIDHPQIRHRFLKEARITCRLTHPAIIPIFSIQASKLSTYYTMPFVEGETLKEIIRRSRNAEKKGSKPDHLGGSIPALMRIFLTVCQAVAYAHAKNILHRDLKPENIIVGKYGEVFILDWGLAKFIDAPGEDLSVPGHKSDSFENPRMTRIGKVVGTVSYMAPERALGQPANVRTDIYSLGAILYQLLTLKNPFKRGTPEEFRRSMKKEELTDPVLAAPYRDVPRNLARLSQNCLSFDPDRRYGTVEEMIYELQNYLEGRSEWFPVGELDPEKKSDWEFQENILIADYVAVTHPSEDSEWVNLMISRQSFAGNIRVETDVCLGEETRGIGILISIPETVERTHLNDGYCLWIGSDKHRTTKLLRSNVETMQAPDIFLKRHQWTKLRVEKIDRTIHLYLDDVLQFSYIAHIPLIGTHVGILSRDTDFTLKPLSISLGSLNLTVNCLAVPDAFLANRDFVQALSEYRRIAYSFPDRAEGREALFRAGLTLIEQSKESEDRTPLLEQALEEFEKLHRTPGGPLEYLGKSLVYRAMNDEVEEIKCFELAYRRYPNHPLLPVLGEQIISRLHEASRVRRIATYRFSLLTVRYFPPSGIDTHTKRLFAGLQKHWEVLPFVEDTFPKTPFHQRLRFAVSLAFWLEQPYVLGEIIDDSIRSDSPSVPEIHNAFACMIELGCSEYARKKFEEIKPLLPDICKCDPFEIEVMLACSKKPSEEVLIALLDRTEGHFTFSQKRAFIFLTNKAIENRLFSLIRRAAEIIEHRDLPFDVMLRFNCCQIEAYLLEKNWTDAEKILYSYPVELLNKHSTPLYFLYGCWLQGAENSETAAIHFTDFNPLNFPPSWLSAGYFIRDQLPDKWFKEAFPWEKKELYRQLSLYYHCADDPEKSLYYRGLSLEQFTPVE